MENKKQVPIISSQTTLAFGTIGKSKIVDIKLQNLLLFPSPNVFLMKINKVRMVRKKGVNFS